MIVVIFDFNACSVTASIKIFVFIFAERRCVFGMVGAVPACPPERPHSGVSIPKIHALCMGNLTTDAPLQGDTGGHTAAVPYQKYTHCMRGMNDGCAPAGRHGRAHSGVSIPKIHALCMGNLTTDAPLQGDTGGHIGTAPTNLRYTSAYNPPQRHQPPKRNA